MLHHVARERRGTLPSMFRIHRKKARKSLASRRGSLLIDALLAVTIFGAVVAAFSTGIFAGSEGTNRAGNRVRAVYIADEGLEAVRIIRDYDTADPDDGYALIEALAQSTEPATHGIQLSQSTGTWEISGTETIIDGIFTRKIEFLQPGADDNERIVTSTVDWTDPGGQDTSVVAETILTDWHTDPPPPPPDWSTPLLVGNNGVTDDSYEAVSIQGNYAYVVGRNINVDGFYVWDITTNPAIPAIVDTANINAKFSVDGFDSRAYEIVTDSNYAYVGTSSEDSSTLKIKILDISDPLDVTCCVQEIDVDTGVSTSGEIRGLALDGDKLYATRRPTSATAGYNEFMRFDLSVLPGAAPTMDGVYNDPGLAMDLYKVERELEGTTTNRAYAAGNDPEELTVFDISGVFAQDPLPGVNVTNTIQSYSVATRAGTVFLGTDGNNNNPEVYAFDSSAGTPVLKSSHDFTGTAGQPWIFDMVYNDAADVGLLATSLKMPGSPPTQNYFVAMDFSNINSINSLFQGNNFDGQIGLTETAYGVDVRQSDNIAILVTGNRNDTLPKSSFVIIKPTAGTY